MLSWSDKSDFVETLDEIGLVEDRISQDVYFRLR
jgi:hypothetical protein